MEKTLGPKVLRCFPKRAQVLKPNWGTICWKSLVLLNLMTCWWFSYNKGHTVPLAVPRLPWTCFFFTNAPNMHSSIAKHTDAHAHSNSHKTRSFWHNGALICDPPALGGLRLASSPSLPICTSLCLPLDFSLLPSLSFSFPSLSPIVSPLPQILSPPSWPPVLYTSSCFAVAPVSTEMVNGSLN